MAPSIAWFITPHGFGHAARAAACMEELRRLSPSIGLEIFTTVPRWFFEDSLGSRFNYHEVACDVGLVQRDPLNEDIPATLERLERFVPFSEELMRSLASKVAHCALVCCDIAPLGIAVAERVGVPSVVIENFTWDWVYRGYTKAEPRLEKFAAQFEARYRAASYHIQTEPICSPSPSANLSTGIVARVPRQSRAETRRKLALAEDAKVVLMSMGGVKSEPEGIEHLGGARDLSFVIMGSDELKREGNVLYLPRSGSYFHPDIVCAADLVVDKVGYSTLAETYAAGVPFMYRSRTQFREARVLERFVDTEMRSARIEERSLKDGTWLEAARKLLGDPRVQSRRATGAGEISLFFRRML